MRSRAINREALFLWIIIFLLVLAAPGGIDGENQATYATGLLPNTPEQEQLIRTTWPRVKKIKFNRLALERVNEARLKKGLGPFDPRLAVPLGEETEIEIGETTPPASPGEPISTALMSVDNSVLPYFPPIDTQGSLNSCASFNITYYQMTHLFAFLRGWQAKTGGHGYHFSPKWTYNFINNGANGGSYFSDNYDVIRKHGAPTWAEFPYDDNFTAWCLSTTAWRNALSYRTNPVQYISNVSVTGLQQVKDLLANGYILVIGTYISSWQFKTISDDPLTTEDNAYVGKDICYWLNGANGSHAMTCVGFNDAIWVDINSNGIVDSGEKGALRIANSWGAFWKDGGYTWLAYDALRSTSQVPGAPSDGRIAALQSDRMYHLTASGNYAPKVIAQFTVNHAARNEMRMSLGTSATSQTTPTTAWTPGALINQGGAYAFDGSSNACDGTFVLDFTDILPTAGVLKRYHLGMYDNASGNIATLKSYKLIDLTTPLPTEVWAANVPQTADGNQQVYAWVDYTYNGVNAVPIAIVSATPQSGPSPLLVSFDGSGSYDTDGTIVSYSWTFGDGTAGTGSNVQHTYAGAGIYTARLTVTDNLGATGTCPVIIIATSLPATLTVTPPGGLESTGLPGGPFMPASMTYTLQNTGGASLNWTATKTQGWVTLSSGSGTLAPWATTTVIVWINSNANALPVGTAMDTIAFTNTTNDSGSTTRPVTLNIGTSQKEWTFVRGTDNYLYGRYMDKSENISTWLKLTGKSSHAPAAMYFNGKVYLMVKSDNDARIYWNRMDSAGTWSTWKTMDGATSGSPAVALFNSQLYIAVRGTDNKIYVRSMNSAEIFSPWQAVPGGMTDASPAVESFNGKLYLIVKDSVDYKIWWNKMDPSGVWATWQLLGGLSPSPSAMTTFNNQLYIAVQGTDNKLYYRAMNTSELWTSWAWVPGYTDVGPAIDTYNNRIYWVVKGESETKIWWNAMTASGTWSTWKIMDGATPSPVALASTEF